MSESIMTEETQEDILFPKGDFVFPNGDTFTGEYISGVNGIIRNGNGKWISKKVIFYSI